MKKFAGLKKFKSNELGRYDRKVIISKSSRSPKMVLYSSGKEIASYVLGKSTKVEDITRILEKYGITPSAKRRF